MTVKRGPVKATSFDVGRVCPRCQETISIGQMLVTCDRCACAHHDTCWEHGHGCSSYTCSSQVNVALAGAATDIVITGDDASRAQPLLPRSKNQLSREEEQLLNPALQKWNWLAVGSATLAGLSAVGIVASVWARSMVLLAAGTVACIVTILLGVISMVVINTKPAQKGFPLAVVGTLASCAMVVLYVMQIGAFLPREHRQGIWSRNAEGEMTVLSNMESMPKGKADALRANVVVLCNPKSVFRGSTKGSGVIMGSAAGKTYILTNRHVVESGLKGEIEVFLFNGESTRASVEWLAPNDVDVAVISARFLSVKDMPYARLAESLLDIGTPVFAVGNPMGLNWSYTEGVISGVRQQSHDPSSIRIYQTQAPINKGNSGGGLYDMTGMLIGVNTWIEDKAVAEGLGFAIATPSILAIMGDEQKRRFLAAPDSEKKDEPVEQE